VGDNWPGIIIFTDHMSFLSTS